MVAMSRCSILKDYSIWTLNHAFFGKGNQLQN